MGRTGTVWMFALAVFLGSAFSPQIAYTQAFDTASVKLAPAGMARAGDGFMLPIPTQPPPRGLLTVTVPLNVYISFAYGIRDEVEIRSFTTRLPDWARGRSYTVVARAPQDAPSLNDLRAMMRGLLEERFALKAHTETHAGPVNRLVFLKPGVPGPAMKPHAAGCQQRDATKASEPGKPRPLVCGWDLYTTAGGLLHISMAGVTLPQAAGQFGGLGGLIGGRGMETVVDGTGLQGEWDMTIEFQPERRGPVESAPGDTGGPTFTGALEKQLGLRLQRGTGPVKELVIDHIAAPTAD